MAVNPTPLSPKTKNKLGSLVIMTSVAVVLGLVAAGGIWQYMNQAQQKVKELTVTRAVVVASKEIPAGKKLADEDLTIKQFPAQTVPKDYPAAKEAVKGRIVKNTLQADEVISESRLVGEGAAGGLPVVIPPGNRAITIKVNEVFGVGGFINPGDRVDVLSILTKDEKNTFSKTILKNVLVLAVGDKIFDKNSVAEPQAKVVGQVTLALNMEDSEKLALASQIGQIYLSLRPIDEKIKDYETEGVRLVDIYGSLAYVPQDNSNFDITAVQASAGKSDKNSIELILGNERSYFYY